MFREGNYKKKEARGKTRQYILKYPAEESTRYMMSWRNPLAGTNPGPEGSYDICFGRLRIDKSCNTSSTMSKCCSNALVSAKFHDSEARTDAVRH